MKKTILLLLDNFLIFFHTLLILFNLLGWIWKRTRKLNLIILLLVAFSWLILGIWFGIGYCPFTDLHWFIKIELGESNLPYSYIKYLVDFYLGIDSEPVLIDYITAISFACALIISSILNFSAISNEKNRNKLIRLFYKNTKK